MKRALSKSNYYLSSEDYLGDPEAEAGAEGGGGGGCGGEVWLGVVVGTMG